MPTTREAVRYKHRILQKAMRPMTRWYPSVTNWHTSTAWSPWSPSTNSKMSLARNSWSQKCTTTSRVKNVDTLPAPSLSQSTGLSSEMQHGSTPYLPTQARPPQQRSQFETQPHYKNSMWWITRSWWRVTMTTLVLKKQARNSLCTQQATIPWLCSRSST